MAKYVMLLTWTDWGVKQMGQTTQRAKRVRQIVEELGGTEEIVLWTGGRYDVVAIYDLPDEDKATVLDMRINALGTVRTEMMRGLTVNEMSKLLSKVPAGNAGGASDSR
jgi:uncharacterized protein with GYD domain